MPPEIRVGVALGSGGARGLAHAGVLDAFDEAGFRPDLVVGTSMGAIVGGLYAERPEAARVWERLLTYVQDKEFASYWSMFVPREAGENEWSPQSRLSGIYDFMQRKMIAVRTVTRLYLENADRLRRPLENLFTVEDFDDLQLEFAAVAMDLISGKPVVFTRGNLIDALYGSSAIPAVFPPFEHENMLICDGGGPYRVPVETCRALGADIVVAVDIPAFDDTRFSTGLDLILRSNTVARQRLNAFVCATADLVIRPDVAEFHWADFRSGEACRARGYVAARSLMPRLQRMIDDWPSWRSRLRRGLARRLGLWPLLPPDDPSITGSRT
jgi:NTE family protein